MTKKAQELATHEKDTGSSEVQIALLTEKITGSEKKTPGGFFSSARSNSASFRSLVTPSTTRDSPGRDKSVFHAKQWLGRK